MAPSDLDDLAEHELIGYDPALAGVPAAQWIGPRAARATIVLRSRESVEMLEAATAGVGLAMLPCLLGNKEPLLVRLTSEVLATREVSLVYRRETKISPAIPTVIGLVVATMTAHADRGRAG